MNTLFAKIKNYTTEIKNNFNSWQTINQLSAYFRNPDPLCLLGGVSDPKKTNHFLFHYEGSKIPKIEEYLSENFQTLFSDPIQKEKLISSLEFKNSVNNFLYSNLRTPAHLELS